MLLGDTRVQKKPNNNCKFNWNWDRLVGGGEFQAPNVLVQSREFFCFEKLSARKIEKTEKPKQNR